MFSVNGKVERLLLFDPRDTKRQRAPLSLLPCRAFRRRNRLGRVAWSIDAGKDATG